jgi:IS30 family transposase
MTHCYQLSINEREEIGLGLAQGLSKIYIALSLGRSSSTICREVNRNTVNRQAYRAVKAQGRAHKLRHLARKSRKMDMNLPLRDYVLLHSGSIVVSGTDCQTSKNIVS